MIPRQRALVIDDDPAVGALMARIARKTGYEAIVTDDPDDFLERVDSWSPSILVIDLVMPGVDGIEILKRLGKSRCRAWVLLVSGFDDRVLDGARKLGEAYSLRMAGVVRKPFRVDDLAEVFGRLESANVLSPGRIRSALARSEFHLAFQPKYDLAARRVTGVEALARWTDSEHGAVPPSQFIQVAEEAGFISEITNWVAEQAVRQQAAWTRAGVSLNLAINVSRADLEQGDLPTFFTELCRAHDVAPSAFTFELTESMAMRDERAIGAALARLRLAGAKLAVDDFGSGYSSLQRLLDLPFTELKIDRSLVCDCTTARDSATIVRTVVDLAHNLELTAVAEGVETPDQVEFLRGVGCDSIQGFVVGKAVPLDDLPRMLDRIDL